MTADEHEWLAKRFEEHRTHLRAVAYRMLGSLPEADEAVQDACTPDGSSRLPRAAWRAEKAETRAGAAPVRGRAPASVRLTLRVVRTSRAAPRAPSSRASVAHRGSEDHPFGGHRNGIGGLVPL